MVEKRHDSCTTNAGWLLVLIGIAQQFRKVTALMLDGDFSAALDNIDHSKLLGALGRFPAGSAGASSPSLAG